MLDFLFDAFIDSCKLLPFLFLTYWVMEYIEHKTGDKTKLALEKSGKWGPVIGSLLGVIPQCGMSAAAANLYAGRMITKGTLLAIFLSTSDEMLPVMISRAAGGKLIGQVLLWKVLVALLAGCLIDGWLHRKGKKPEEMDIHGLCEKEHCHCEHSLFRSALNHTLHIFIFILIISCFLNGLIAWIGADTLATFISDRMILGPVVAGVIGLIPNCAASVALTQLYLDGFLSFGSMMAGLLVGAGVGVLVLLRVNHDKKDNLRLIATLFFIGVVAGIVFNFFW